MSYADIQRWIDSAVRANGGRAFINENTVSKSAHVRAHLEALANACGLPEPKEQGLSNSQLAMLYATARKAPEKARGMAAQWAQDMSTPPPPRGEFNPLLDPVPAPAPAPYVPESLPEPTSAPFDLEAVLEAARKEASAMADYIARDRLEDAQQAIRGEAIGFLVREVEGLQQTIEGQVTKAIAALTPTQLTVTLPDTSSVELGTVHYNQSKLITMLAAGCNVYLYGPAGSGKTTAGKHCAKAFKLPFYFTGKIDSEYLLLGFNNAQGETVRTQFREAYEHGGVFLFDEIDRSAPSAFTALNAALANGICAFPDGVIAMHKDFKCIAAGNTRMSGADNTYIAGQQQDASSVDRFAFLQWGYDEKLERALASNAAWCEYVQAARAQVEARGINHLITPRATLDGCKLLSAGLSWQETSEAVLWKGLEPSTVQQIADAIEHLQRDAA